MMDEIKYKKWLQKRHSTYLVYCLQYFISGAEVGFKNATLWLYVTTVLKCSDPYLWFGIIHSSIYLPSLLFNPIISRISDKIRRPKLMVTLSNIVAIVGNLIYIIPYSPVYAATGFILFGFKYTLRPIMIGEIVRSYPAAEVTHKLPAIVCARNFGMIAAVLFLLPFQHVQFSLFTIPVSYGNVTGVIGTALYIIIQILVYFFVHDLSNEYDLKKVEQEANNKSKKRNKNLRKAVNWTQVFLHPDILLIFFATFMNSLLQTIMICLQPVIVLHKLKYSPTVLNTGLICETAFCFVTLVVIMKAKISSHTAYFIAFTSFLFIIIIETLYTFASPVNDMSLNLVFIIAAFLCMPLQYLGEDVFFMTVTSKLVKSDIQSTTESIRSQIRHLGCLLAGLLIGPVTTYYFTFVIISTMTTLIYFIWMVIRYPTLSDPKPIQW